MANEIAYADPQGTTGLNIYARIRTPVNTFWNGSAFVAYSAASWATYAVALTDSGGGLYLANMPGGIPAGAYYLDAYKRLGGSPASTDQLLGATPFPMQWNGSAEEGSMLEAAIGGGTLRAAMRAVAAVLAGKITQSADGAVNTFKDFLDDNTTRVTSTSSQTERAVQVQ